MVGGSGFAVKRQKQRITESRVAPPRLEIYQWTSDRADNRERERQEGTALHSNRQTATLYYRESRDERNARELEEGKARHLRNIAREISDADEIRRAKQSKREEETKQKYANVFGERKMKTDARDNRDK